jgi:hypothetical protein
MFRKTMGVLLLTVMLAGTLLLMRANAQPLKAPASTPPADTTAPPADEPAPGFPLFGFRADSKPADPTAQTDRAVKELLAALEAQARALKARGEFDAAAQERLARSLGEIFDLRQQLQLREIQMIEDRLHGIKDQVTARGKNREAIVAAQVKQILEGKEILPPTKTPSDGSGLPKRDPTPRSGPEGGGPMGGFPPGGIVPGIGFPAPSTPKPEVPRFEPIQIGLPDDLVGQLLQAKNDADRALIGASVQFRITLLKGQLQDAQTEAARMKQLAAQKAIDQATVDRAESRLRQLMVLLEAHEVLRQKIGR